MKTITIWQPWASLIAIGAKHYETRSWATNYRGPIAIHAAALNPFKAIKLIQNDTVMEMRRVLKDRGILTPSTDFRMLPLGCIIATAKLVNCWHIVCNPGVDIDVAKHIPIGAESITIDKHAPDFADYFIPTEQEQLFGDWTPGRYAWQLEDVVMLKKPIPVKGQQRLWNFDDRLLKGAF